MEDHASANQQPKRSEALKKRGGWGGRRPGAGAPKGNLNGLKHGMRSKQLAALAAYLARNPKIGAIVAAHARRRGVQEERLEKLASRFLGELVLRRLDLDDEEVRRLRRVAMDMLDD